MTPTELLRGEHRIIERVLAVLQRAADRLEKGEQVDPAIFEQAIDFIRNFADRYHHAKEEEGLFTTMQVHGVPRNGGPIGVMLMEHEEGRAHVRGMAEALEDYPVGNGVASDALTRHARGYADLLQAHIYKEDNILYPIGERVLSAKAQQGLMEEFQTLERRVLSPQDRQRYLEMVERLEKAL